MLYIYFATQVPPPLSEAGVIIILPTEEVKSFWGYKQYVDFISSISSLLIFEDNTLPNPPAFS